MHEVRDKIEVALRPSPTALCAERLLVGKAQQQQSQVVDEEVEGVVKEARALLDEIVVSGQGAGEVSLGDFRAPEREEAVALGVGVL